MPIRPIVDIEGLPAFHAAAAGLPRAAQEASDDATERIARDEASRIRGAAARSSRQSARVAGSVRAVGGSAPGVSAGGVLFFGAEFGARTLRQFRPHRGHTGYWFWPTLRADERRIDQRWDEAGDAIEQEWVNG